MHIPNQGRTWRDAILRPNINQHIWFASPRADQRNEEAHEVNKTSERPYMPQIVLNIPCKTSFFTEGDEVPRKLLVSSADHGRRNSHYHTCDMFEYMVMLPYCDDDNLHHFTFCLQSGEPVTAVVKILTCFFIRHRVLKEVDLSVVIVKHPSPKLESLCLLQMTRARCQKSSTIQTILFHIF